MEYSFLRVARFLPLLIALPAAAEVSPATDNIADLSIEELANIPITSVSKKPERLAGAAASVFVITSEDIRHAGAATIPDALRLAPNLQVAQNTGHGYAITARGMNGSNNSGPNKLLVLIDGRSVYAPLFSGIFWDTQDVMIEDVERIEVISGPGGTLWGVNAVNGVINVITRNATDTSGALAALRAGELGSVAAFRYGGGGTTPWRVYGKYLDDRHLELANGARVNDARHQVQVGFRTDFGSGPNRFSLHGNAYDGSSDQPEPGLITVTGTSLRLGKVSTSGANLTGRWDHALGNGASLALQAYLDHSKRTVVPTYAEELDIADVQFQHSLAPAGRHSLVWGANYRYSWDKVSSSSVVAFLPGKDNQAWASLFAQDEIALRDDLRLTLGARVERNDYTGTELLPTVRVAWTLSPAHALWAALSRTVRAPSRLDVDTFIPGAPPYILRGGPQVRSEVAKVIELGYKGQPRPDLSYTVTAWHNDYDHLRTQEVAPTQDFVTFSSLMEGKSTGIEMWGSYQAASFWRLSAGLMALHQRFTLKEGSNDLAGPGSARKDPSHTAQLRSSFNWSDDKEIDIGVRKVGALANPAVPGYVALDARLGWRIRKNVELSLLAQNLNGDHGEYGPQATRAELQRALSVKLVWQQ